MKRQPSDFHTEILQNTDFYKKYIRNELDVNDFFYSYLFDDECDIIINVRDNLDELYTLIDKVENIKDNIIGLN